MKDTPSSTLNLEPLLALFFTFIVILSGCTEGNKTTSEPPLETPFIMILGVAQDAGYPQAGEPEEFKAIKLGQMEPLYTVSLGLVDPKNNKRYLIDATPDFKEQLQLLDEVSSTDHYPTDGIFLTHAHIGHYTGLMHLGREVMGADSIPVYAMPRMKIFLDENGPWNQLIELNNIHVNGLRDSTAVNLSEDISVMPFIVPHRDEYSETVGYKITIKDQSVVFIPDIDKWDLWSQNLAEVVKSNDYILIDASFFEDGELKDRDMSLIPHPFTTESMELLKNLSDDQKAKVYFIHANHTNPILSRNSSEYEQVIQAGFNVAEQGQVIRFQIPDK